MVFYETLFWTNLVCDEEDGWRCEVQTSRGSIHFSFASGYADRELNDRGGESDTINHLPVFARSAIAGSDGGRASGDDVSTYP